MKKSFIALAFVVFSILFLSSYSVSKVLAYTQQEQNCINLAMNCANRCAKTVNYKNVGTAAEACAQNCANEVMASCNGLNNPQPNVQQPQQNTQPTVLQTIPTPAEKGKYFSHDYSGELTDLLGPDSPGGPYTFDLDTMGGFPPMGLILGPNGVLQGTPTGRDSKFKACVKDVGGNTACKVLEIDVKKEGESEFVVPKNFQLTELAYSNLTVGKQFQSGDQERIALKMPDGSLLQMDMNSMVIPVSDYEVKSDIGRYRFDYKTAGGGGCGPIGQSPTWACRQVDARDATLRVKGTEFLVDSDKYGTNITVMKGVLSVSDTRGNKTVDVIEGKYTYIKNGGIPSDPQSFDLSQVDYWWKEKTAEEIKRIEIVKYVVSFFVLFLPILFIKRKQIWPKRFGALNKTNTSLAKNLEGYAVASLMIGLISEGILLSNYVGIWLPTAKILDYISSPIFLIVETVGLILGIIGYAASKTSFANFIIMLNAIGIVIWIMSPFGNAFINSF